MEKQLRAAKEKIGNVTEAAKDTLADVPEKVRTALAKPQAAVSKLKKKVSSTDKTRKELYEEAKKRNLPGRSKMTKDELARALRKK